MGIISDKLFRIAKLSPEDMKVELLVLAEEQAREEHRLLMQRNRTQKCRANRYGNITVTDRYGNGLDKTDRDSNVTVTVPIYSKEVSKKESKIFSNNSSSFSNRRVSKKRCQIDPELICSSRNREDALKAGMPESSIDTEWVSFVDHHLHKGTLGLDWNAGWRRWCANHVKWNSKPPATDTSTAKPLTPRQQILLNNMEIVRALEQGTLGTNYAGAGSEDGGEAEIVRPLGRSGSEIIPPDRNPDHARVHASNGKANGKLS